MRLKHDEFVNYLMVVMLVLVFLADFGETNFFRWLYRLFVPCAKERSGCFWDLFDSPSGKDLEKEAKEDQAENNKMESLLTETYDCPVLQN